MLQQSLLTDFIGVVIADVDLSRPLDADSRQLIRTLFDTRQLLLFPNQNLSEAEYSSFSHLFSTPVPSVLQSYALELHPEISCFSNLKNTEGNKTGAMAREYFWHSDSYFMHNPNKATLMYAKESPRRGGETHFINMRLAYEALCSDLKNLIQDKKAIYRNGYLNRPPVRHPLVRKNTLTREKALFVNINRAIGIEGMPEKEGLEILDELYTTATTKSKIYKHKWQNGDLLVWDNSSTMHTATPIEDTEIRVLYRILTAGDLPVT